MTSSTITSVNDNERMDPNHPRADGPRRRRAFTASEKLAHLTPTSRPASTARVARYLRREGLYSSLISEWRKQRDAGVLAGKRPGEKVGRLTAEQAEIARLTREIARDEQAVDHHRGRLGHHGKSTRSLGESFRESGLRRAAQEAMTHTYMSLIAGGVSTRHAAALTGMVRSTATRRQHAATAPTPAVSAQPAGEPVNKLTDLERRRVLEVLTSDRFVDLAPLQIYAQLLDEGVYLCSVSTMYRVLAENTLVAERRRLARHPAKVCPELVATAPRQVYSLGHHQARGPGEGHLLRCLRDDRHLLPLPRRGRTSMPTNPGCWPRN